VTLAPKPFNKDTMGWSQNEESGAVCRTNTNDLLQGDNDYRAVVSSTGNLTGYDFSNDGGSTITQDGQLPSITFGGATVPSGGDPVMRWSSGCTAFASDIDYRFDSTGATLQSGVVVRSNTAANLGTCTSPSTCWPTAKVIDSTTTSTNFMDKDWMAVGNSGGTEYVWVTYTKYIGNAGYIYASRCNLALTSCSAPAQVSDAADTVSDGSKFTEFSYVTIGPDGRVYVVYATFTRDTFGAYHFGSIKMKIAPAGGTTFGASTVVASPSTTAIPFFGALHSDDFRITTQPKVTVAMVGSTPRIFVTDEECTALISGGLCEDPQIKVRYSDNSGSTWTLLTFGTAGKDNYFPTIATDPSTSPNKVALAWYSSANDPALHRYDVYLASFPADLSTAAVTTRITSSPNEPDADPFLGGLFIGDYFEVFAAGGNAYLNFNQNTRTQKWQGLGVKVRQQDNFLAIATL